MKAWLPMLLPFLVWAQSPPDVYEWARWAQAAGHIELEISLFETVRADPQSPVQLKASATRQLARLALLEEPPDVAAAGVLLGEALQLMRGSQLTPEPVVDRWYRHPLAGDQSAATDTIRYKLSHIIIPSIKFEAAPAWDVATFLSKRSRELDPTGQGVNIVLVLADGNRAVMPCGKDSPMHVDFDNIPLGEAIRYLCCATGWSYRIEDHAVILAEPNQTLQALHTRVYPMTRQAVATMKMHEDSRACFESRGVWFPAGASLAFLPTTSCLIVTNTADNHRWIGEILTAYDQEQLMVKIRAHVLEAQLQASAMPGDVPAMQALLQAKPRWLSSQSLVVDPAAGSSRLKTSVMELDVDVRSAGAYHARMNLDLNWNWRSPEGESHTIETRLTVNDGAWVVLPVQELGTRQRLLLVSAQVTRHDDNPIRPTNWGQRRSKTRR